MTHLQKLITIDGPSGAGKGTASRSVAHALGWDYLDSGAIYRILGYAATQHHVDSESVSDLVRLASQLDIHFDCKSLGEPKVFLGGVDVSLSIRSNASGEVASKVSKHQPVRDALLKRQQDFFTKKGLVADGRDMGTIVFPQAPLKIYLSATVQVRAERRFKQLLSAGYHVSIDTVLQEVKSRDTRDMNRKAAPLRPAQDAIVIDTSDLSIQDVCDRVLSRARVIFA